LLFLFFFLLVVHNKSASTGVIDSFNSCPYKHNPASKRKASLAPKPANLHSLNVNNNLTKSSTCELCIDISKPSSPVYPDRDTWHGAFLLLLFKYKFKSCKWKNFKSSKLNTFLFLLTIWDNILTAFGPCNAIKE